MVEQQAIDHLQDFVDVPDALARVCGNKTIYKKLLGTFQKTLQYDQLRSEVQAGDLESATRTAHAIKGVTANLSLKAAYEKTVQIEAQLKAGNVSESDLDNLGDILHWTLECTEHLISTL